MRGIVVLVALCLLFTPIAFFSLALLLKMGIQESYRYYGPGFTLLLCLSVVPCLVTFGFLLDRRGQQSPNSPKGSRFPEP
jgi:uncharacterized membrane protein YqjE